MLTLLQSLNVGDKIVVGFKSFYGEIVDVHGKYLGNIEQYGYYFKDGGWGLYSLKKYMPYRIEEPCYKFLFKEKGKRKSCSLRIGYDVLDIRLL